MKKISQVVLVILDGWGVASSWGGNAIAASDIINFSYFWRNYPHTTLHASGKWVGLPGDERGNSEVGHLNLGAGYVVTQDSEYISSRLTKEKLDTNETIKKLLDHLKNNNSNLHLMGLCSKGGIHSHINHLYALLEYFANFKDLQDKVFVHAFTDGRDSAPQDSLEQISELSDKINEYKIGKIATISGRYYAMDRDNRWQRVEKAYNAIVLGEGKMAKSPLAAISEAYTIGETDEFITPTVVTDISEKPVAKVSDNDAIIYFNYRSDRARELTLAFTDAKFKNFKRKKLCKNLFFVNMVPYGIESDFESNNIYPLFHPEQNKLSLAAVLSENHVNQLHVAETEKYAHVTYFFNGGVEIPYPQEDRIMVDSPKVPTYDQKPEMSAAEIAHKSIDAIKHRNYSFVVINFANADMVGHTGNFKATVLACEKVDEELKKIFDAIDKEDTALIITADHGNAEQMTNPKTGESDTEHTADDVPFILIKPKWLQIGNLKSDGKLANVAPTILKLLNIPIPEGMDEPIY